MSNFANRMKLSGVGTALITPFTANGEKVDYEAFGKLIDNYKIDGDFIESQAFAFLAIRSFQGLPISFPGTTGCKKACTGGELIKH